MVEVGDPNSFHQPFIHQLFHGLKTKEGLPAADTCPKGQGSEASLAPVLPLPSSASNLDLRETKRRQDQSQAGFHETGRAKAVTEGQNAGTETAEQISYTSSTHKDNRKPAVKKKANPGAALPPRCPENRRCWELRCLWHPAGKTRSQAVVATKTNH